MPKVNINGNELYILNSQRKGAAIAVKAVISRKGFYEELGNISIPSLIIIGDQDKLVQPEQSLKMQKRIAESELMTIPNAVSLLSHGMSVVLDFPANTKDQRNWFRAIYEQANVSHTLHYVDVSNDICKRQLKERSKDKPEGSAFTSDAEFDAITKYFQAPSIDEGFNIIRYQR